MFSDCKSLKKFSFYDDFLNEQNINNINDFISDEIQTRDNENSNKVLDDNEKTISLIDTKEEGNRNNETVKNLNKNLAININNYANMEGMF